MRIVEIVFINLLILSGIAYVYYQTMFKVLDANPEKAMKNALLGNIARVQTADGESLVPVRRCTQLERWQYIQKQCEGMNYWTEPSEVSQHYNHRPFIVTMEREVAYCYIPKNGCSAWKKILTSTTRYGQEHGRVTANVHQQKVLEKWGLRKASFRNILENHPNYTRFMVVRNPFDRLVSAYIDKFVSQKENYYTNVAKHIIENFSKKTEELDREIPSFTEFVKFLLSGGKYSKDRHWIPYGDRCNPCYLDYHHVVRVETMAPDSEPVMQKLGIADTHELDQYRHIHDKVTMRHRNQNSTVRMTHVKPKYLQEFEDIPNDLVQQLYQRYKEDFLLFGYHFDFTSLMTSCRIPTDAGDMCC